MDIHALYTEITSTYAEKILNWAVRKTGCRADGEDLAQEVLLQVFWRFAGSSSVPPSISSGRLPTMCGATVCGH